MRLVELGLAGVEMDISGYVGWLGLYFPMPYESKPANFVYNVLMATLLNLLHPNQIQIYTTINFTNQGG